MDLVHDLSRYLHVGVGFLGLAAFWVPVFSRKGSRLHVVIGKVFIACAYVVAGSALLGVILRAGEFARSGRPLADYETLVLLAYLSIVTLALARHAVRVIETRKAPADVNSRAHRALIRTSQASSLLVIAFAVITRGHGMVILLAMSPIGIATGIGMIRYLDEPTRFKMGWMYEHIGAILGTGIAFHTAFAVFGAVRLFNLQPGAWMIIPWLAPTALGLTAIALWTRHYRRKFNE